jgi:hypothetical protein
MLDRDSFLKGMAYLAAAYPDYEIKPETTEVYWERLKDQLTPPEWEWSINRHIETHKWFPKISEILEMVRASKRPPATLIWEKLKKAAESGVKPEMDQPTQVALAAIGGWEVFQYTSYDELRFRFAIFRDAYNFYVEHRGLPELPIDLPPKEIEEG